MKRLYIFIIVVLSVIKGVSQESEEEYYEEEETQSDEYSEDGEEQKEDQNNYFDFYKYFDFTNDEYSNVLDKVNEMSAEEEEILYKFVVEVQQDKVLKDRLFRELVAKVKKKKPYKGKDSPGFNCVIEGLKENKTVYDAIIKDGRSEQQARNAAALSERTVRRKCGITKKVNKDE
ncbi:hypothetical protein D1818_15695 [Aquimarina sp. BL5]|uniref:hypothetical protein n=1 Tax=Aquimarina sp. BL5 TaxID=1714860 RepID=UPI000E4DC409|nr:hypothetical protein [Aquimarina sp. BL5]AXT52210.1 hypothetical protein D1818_15695 [Aquimarina sp. BL5]RKM91852.1 hypothetical protein D7036_23115 [Aquimarina sp. BL5]